MTEIGGRCRGRWKSILLALGVDSKVLSGKQVPCPWCGGTDRFQYRDKKGDGFWLCRQCGHGDGFEFVKRMLNVDFPAAARRIEEVVGSAPVIKTYPVDEEKRRAKLNSLWRGAVAITMEDPAGRYLTQRGLALPPTGDALRWSSENGSMLAKVVGPSGKPVTVQQTFIGKDGVKTGRKTFWGQHPLGTAVRLDVLAGDEVGIAEGVETAMSARVLFDMPTWSALDATHLMKWKPPTGVRRVHVFADNDASFTGQAAGYALAKDLKRDGYDVEVSTPEEVGTDWNDVLRKSRGTNGRCG